MGVILVGPIRTYSFHGCLPEEEKIGGNYLVNVKINADFSEAEKNDELSSTIDYCDVYQVVVREMAIRSKLIEHVAARIAEVLKNEIAKIEKVKVTVTKIAPPMNGDVAEVSVIVSRS